MASAGLTVEEAGAARAVAAIVRHAAGQRDGVVSIQADGDEAVIASPGETSMLMVRLPAGRATVPEGTWAPTGAPPATAGEAAGITLRGERGRLTVSAGMLRMVLERVADEPVDVTWVWPATEPVVEAVVSRDALLDSLPSGEGRLAFAGADKQVVLEAGRTERRLPLKNRTRRRKDIGVAVAFDQLHRLVEAASADVAIGLADLRPLTIESGPVRGMLVRGAPMRWRPGSSPAPGRQTVPAAAAKAAPARNAAAADARRRREAEQRAREQEQEARRRARSAGAAVAAIGRAASQLDAAIDDARQLGDDEAGARLADARAALDAAEDSLRRHLDS